MDENFGGAAMDEHKDWRNRLEESGKDWPICSCGADMSYFSGLENIPAFYYCPTCRDIAWGHDEKGMLVRLMPIMLGDDPE